MGSEGKVLLAFDDDEAGWTLHSRGYPFLNCRKRITLVVKEAISRRKEIILIELLSGRPANRFRITNGFQSLPSNSDIILLS